MKHVYVLATAVLSMLTFANGASAQTYTAVRNGNWSVSSGAGTPWDPNGRPPTNCSNCLITINSNVKVTLDVHVTLTGTSALVLGSDGVGSAQLIIAGSGASNFTSAHNIILSSAGLDNTKLKILYSNSFVDATGTATWDGIFAQNSTYLKQVGNGPWSIFGSDGTPQLQTTIQGGNFLSGPVGLTGSGPLPITLASFEAAIDGNAVSLNWTTAQESNTDHFAVERSTNGGSSWTTIGTLPAAGFSSLPKNYSFVDGTPGSGVNDYRLQIIDRDGKPTFSTIRLVRTGLVSGISVFPNPAIDVVNISLSSHLGSGMMSIRLLNQSGQTLSEKKLENGAGTTISLPVGSYPQGNYLILVTGADGTRQISKLFISRQ
ncbi:MAG: T9SS type A sorting domain-containing protein [Bacteroidota bacterium]|nr:T9SS type A sorting domain-containing protein [Bacteroidota bacterium]MDP4216258.1 T9SS type A sorting domain-containing protein [Bacteroidota bacterium]MDP4246493.1 T9SS type A sorting domain-containing protein [Bacteroidota bacterium]MDP4253113.1 T9SS type A sorting domain-containing protein [Bacteroidota bacterium]MDP4259990.1 T9SS type A sorting domain-containing protein [Bacteroidota bacterium]